MDRSTWLLLYKVLIVMDSVHGGTRLQRGDLVKGCRISKGIWGGSPLLLICLALPALVPRVAAAQSGLPHVNPLAIAVADVSLGMTVDDSIAALKKFDPAYTIDKHYGYTLVQQYGGTGSDLSQIQATSTNDSLLPQKYAFFTDLVATDGTDSVQLWYSLVPGKEQVIGIVRAKTFSQNNNSPLPTLSSLHAGIAAKYPFPYTLESTDSTDWLFDIKKRLISPSMAQEKGLYSASGHLPNNVYSDGGIGLSIEYTIDGGNAGLVDGFSISLYDCAALYNSVAQGQAEYQAGKTKLDADMLNDAAKNAPKTNF